MDYLRNNPNATTVLPWSSRAKASATVSVPIPWEALEAGTDPQDFRLAGQALERTLAAEDAWAAFRAKAFEGRL